MTRFPLLSKALALFAVGLMVVLVLWRIEGLVGERRYRQIEATRGIQQSLAGPQTLLGPLLQRHCVETWTHWVGEGKERHEVTERRESVLAAVPATLKVTGQLRAEARHRGLFKANGYAGPVGLQATWPGLALLQPRREQAGSRMDCTPVRVLLSVSDVRGLRSAQVVADGEKLEVGPGTGHARYTRGLHALLGESRSQQAEGPLVVNVSLDLLGTSQLALVPAAGETNWTLSSDWPHPSFGGRFLPVTREVGEAGFEARWAVSSLASPAAAEAQGNGELCALAEPGATASGIAGAPDGVEWSTTPPPMAAKAGPCLDTLGVAFIDPVNPYVLTDRATKYALLFIALTFVAVALVEVLAQARVHPVQYLLVGLALVLFFQLLLSLSEHLSFGQAYAAASIACVTLLGYYASHMLGRRAAGAWFGAGVALLYGLMWLLLRLEQTALVIGSVALFAVLAAVMVLTRRLDWYALFDGFRRSGSPGPTA